MIQPKDFKKILVAVDDSELGQLALNNAIHQAKEDDAQLFIVSIFEAEQLNVFDYLSKEKNTAAREDVQTALQRYREVAIARGLTNVETYFGEGEPGEVIVKDVVPVVQPDLIVLGSHSQQGIGKYFGSQSRYVVNNAPVSVMVVR